MKKLEENGERGRKKVKWGATVAAKLLNPRTLKLVIEVGQVFFKVCNAIIAVVNALR